MKNQTKLWLGAVLAACLEVGASLDWNSLSHSSTDLNTDFDALAKPILIDVADDGWTNAAAARHALPALKNLLEDPAHKEAFAGARYLGKLKSYSGIGYIQHSGLFQSPNDANRSTSVVANAVFEHGRAKITIDLVRSGDQWVLAGLYARPVT